MGPKHVPSSFHAEALPADRIVTIDSLQPASRQSAVPAPRARPERRPQGSWGASLRLRPTQTLCQLCSKGPKARS